MSDLNINFYLNINKIRSEIVDKEFGQLYKIIFSSCDIPVCN